MANRAQRRAERKKAPKWEKMSKDQLMNHITKNGITLKDLERNYQLGVHAGIDSSYQMCFAAICLALNDLHGFGRVRCQKILHRTQRYIIDTLTTADAVHEVFERMGMKLDFGNPRNWVELEDD